MLRLAESHARASMPADKRGAATLTGRAIGGMLEARPPASGSGQTKGSSAMHRIAFKLKLKPGCLDEYRRRHDEIWPELAALIRSSGISDFRIWHDPETDILFCSQLRVDDARADGMRGDPVSRRWQTEMTEFLVAGPDGLPMRWPLNEVFHLE